MFFLAAILVVTTSSCKKEDVITVPVLTTVNITAITSTSVTANGNVTSDGGAAITERGVCWSTLQNPTIDDYKATGGSLGTGSFTTNISGLTGNSTYYARAYATNSAGTGYSDEKAFTTTAISEYAETLEATAVNSKNATLNGMVNANLMSTIVTFEYGITAGYGQSITADQSPVTGNGSSDVSASLTGLIPASTYHYRVKIASSSGIAYGNDFTFTTNYVVGESALGGIIFYVDDTKQHGLVYATSNHGSGISWYNGSYVTTHATGTALGTGRANTTAIVAAQGSGNYAAYLCDTLVFNSFSDWFLPSIDELHLIYNLEGLNGFVNYYWSSSEFSAENAWFCRQTNNLGFSSDNISKSSTYGQGPFVGQQVPFCVRAVRAY